MARKPKQKTIIQQREDAMRLCPHDTVQYARRVHMAKGRSGQSRTSFV